MAYTDKEMKESTQIVYLNFLEKAFQNLIADGKKGPFSLKELLYSFIDANGITKNLEKSGKDKESITTQDLIQNSCLTDFDKSILEQLSDYMFEWKIVDIHDMNDINGMYSCVIETSKDNAIVAFRGSENSKIYSNLINDWVKADLCLLNSPQTEQQSEVERYANELINTKLLDKYKSISVTGHSLGGNLASHFTVACAQPHRKRLFDKIEQSINFDGPGVSDEYIELHKNEIETASTKMSTYRWSAIGSLLFDIPGVKVKTLDINKDLHKESLIKRISYKLIGRHDTKSLMFDENGKAKEGKQDFISKAFGKISKTIDEKLPYSVTRDIFMLGSNILNHFIYEKKDGTVGFKLPFIGKKDEKQTETEGACTGLLGNIVDTFKQGALAIENQTRSELAYAYAGPKIGCSDVISAATYDNSYNTHGINDFINSIKSDLISSHDVIKDEKIER